jgi:hypothetical protein
MEELAAAEEAKRVIDTLSTTSPKRVSGTMCKEVSVSLPLRGDSHDDQVDDYSRTAGSTYPSGVGRLACDLRV